MLGLAPLSFPAFRPAQLARVFVNLRWHSGPCRDSRIRSSGPQAAAQPGQTLPPAAPPPAHHRSSGAGSAMAPEQQELPVRARAVLDFWFGAGWEAAPPDDTRPQCKQAWYQSTPELDADIKRRFGADCEALLAGQLDSWRGAPLAALAGILLGDQLMRNAYRGTPRMYVADERVLGWAKELLASGAAQQLQPIQRVFVFMTLMHSETLADQDECVSRFEQLAQDCEREGLGSMAAMAREGVQYAEAHRQVVAQWGRFPHRNAILGRTSTPEEAAGIAAGTIPKW